MTEEVDNGYYDSSGQFIEAPKKQLFRLQIPYNLRFALIWTLFFVIAGIVIQSMQAQIFLWKEFFTTNYVQWFRSFGSFADMTIYATTLDFVTDLMAHWYYFFYTGGLISLIWAILSWIIHFELVVNKPSFSQSKSQQFQQPQNIINVPAVPVQQPIVESLKVSSMNQTKIEEWLGVGLLMLSEGNVYEAELIYEQISRAYDANRDIDHNTYKRILDFYYEINERKKR